MNVRFGRRCLGGVGVVALAGVELLVGLGGRSLWHDVSGPGPSSLPHLVALASAAVAFVLGLWLAAGLAVALLERAPGRPGALVRPLARRWAPAVTRRWAALLVGATLSAGGVVATTGSPALAAPLGSASVAVPRPVADPLPGFTTTVLPPAARGGSPLTGEPTEPGWTPAAPPRQPRGSVHLVSGPATARPAGTPSASPGPSGTEVVVTRGDSLWSIVRRALGPEASDAEVARAWPRWYAENRAVIGPDPALIQPGQVLRPPSRPGSRREAAATSAAARP